MPFACSAPQKVEEYFDVEADIETTDPLEEASIPKESANEAAPPTWFEPPAPRRSTQNVFPFETRRT